MYAVIETGGKQYKVAVGDKLKVEKLAIDEGDSVNLERVLLIADGDQLTVGAPVLESSVIAKVVSHGRAGKIKVFKMKRRKDYRRTQGHRQSFTEIEITDIGGAGGAVSSSVATKEKATASKSVAKKPEGKKSETKKSEVKNTETADNKKIPGENIDDGMHESTPDSMHDDLTRINGIGSMIEKKLLAIEITTFKQIAELEPAKIDQLDEQLNLEGRIEREKWVQQASELVK